MASLKGKKALREAITSQNVYGINPNLTCNQALFFFPKRKSAEHGEGKKECILFPSTDFRAKKEHLLAV